MHFFIDHLQLPIQNPDDSFGPDTTNPTIIYNLSSKFQLTTQAKAFACQRGLIIVQQSDEDESLVNVILKPTTKLTIPFQNVAYYVYRGILKSSLIDDSNITSKDPSTNNEIVTRIYSADPNTTLYSASILGFDNTVSADAGIETLFNSSNSTIKSFLVEEGEWFCNFTITHKISFEIVTEPEKVNISISYLRKENSIIDATGITGFDLISKKDEILAFIDPAAFFGLHYKVGINIPLAGNPNTTTTLKGNDIYTNLLSPFFTKNRVYLDIRSEYGYSYNFYRNYLNGNGNNIKFSLGDAPTIERNYATNGWPIIFVDAPQSGSTTENHLRLSLRIDDNLKPVLFFEDSGISENSQDNFVGEDGLLIENNTDWTKELSFKFPNTGENTTKDNVAYYLQMYYFRQEFNADSPPTVLRKEFNIDNFFAPIDLPYLGDENNTFKQSEHTKPIFVTGEHPPANVNPDPTPGDLDTLLNKSNSFSQVVGSGAYYDSNLTTFYSKLRIPKKQSGRSLLASPYKNFGLNLDTKFAKQSFLANDLAINTIEIQEIIGTDTFQQVNLLNVFANNNVQHKIEDIAILGLTKAELQSLKDVLGLSPKHSRQLIFQPVHPSPTDKNGIPYNKYTLQVLGLDNNGNSAKVNPAIDINVYSTKAIMALSSKDYANTVKNNYFIQEPLLSNGIGYELLSLTNDNLNNYPLIGGCESRGNIEDLKSGKTEETTGIRKDVLDLNEVELLSHMTQLFHTSTLLDEEMYWTAQKFINNFKTKSNKIDPYTSPIIDDRVGRSSEFINFVKTFGKDFEGKLLSSNGDITHIEPIIYLKNTTHPVFDSNFDKGHGLIILIHNTESTSIKLEPGSYSYNPETKVWSAIIVVEILDHFGLDRKDAVDHQTDHPLLGIGVGIASWWVLQHKFGYIPFTTKITVRCRIIGLLLPIK